MKQSIKTSIMVLVAMFAFSTAADAQFGKLLKKGPESYEDVRGLVTADYQEEMEKAWVNELRKRYTVVVNNDVLDTVNKHN